MKLKYKLPRAKNPRYSRPSGSTSLYLQYKDPHLHYIAITAIIHKKGKYLIVKRSPNETAFPNMWTVPGGRISVEDYIALPKQVSSAWYGAIENTLKREVKEEVNLTVKNPRYLIDMTFIRPDGIPVVVLSYHADYKSGKVKLDKDNADFTWVSVKEAKKYNLISGIYEEIIMADKLIKGVNPSLVKFEPRR